MKTLDLKESKMDDESYKIAVAKEIKSIMPSDKYDIYFKGEPEKGVNMQTAKSNFANIFKMDTIKIEHFFSGKPVRLKKLLDNDTAKKYQSTLKKAGIKVYITISKHGAGQSSTQPKAKSFLQLLPTGADVLRKEERPETTVRDIDTSAINATANFSRLADEPGFDGAIPDISHLTAETGFERLEEQEKVTAITPNTDHINLI